MKYMTYVSAYPHCNTHLIFVKRMYYADILCWTFAGHGLHKGSKLQIQGLYIETQDKTQHKCFGLNKVKKGEIFSSEGVSTKEAEVLQTFFDLCLALSLVLSI